MQFVPDEVQKILINSGLYENIRFANLKEKDKSWFGNEWKYEFDEGSGYASYDWVRNNYIANFNITSSDNSILINFINRIDATPQKLDLKINLNKIPFNRIDNKTIIKNDNDEIVVSDLKQDKLISGTNIKTINGNSLLGNGDIYISSNNWENVDMNGSNTQIPNFNNSKYIYIMWFQINDDYEFILGPTRLNFVKPTTLQFTLGVGGLTYFTIDKLGKINFTSGSVTVNLVQRKKVIYSNYNSELMADEPQHSIYKRDMDIDLPKEISDSSNIVQQPLMN